MVGFKRAESAGIFSGDDITGTGAVSDDNGCKFGIIDGDNLLGRLMLSVLQFTQNVLWRRFWAKEW